MLAAAACRELKRGLRAQALEDAGIDPLEPSPWAISTTSLPSAFSEAR